MIIPRGFWVALEKLVRAKKPIASEVVFARSDRKIRAQIGNVKIYAETIEGSPGSYPNYAQVIPETSLKTRIEVRREDFLAAAERIAGVVNLRTQACKIVCRAYQIQIGVADPVEFHSTAENVEAKIGEWMRGKEIGFNLEYLLAAIRPFQGETLSLEWGVEDKSEISPVIIRDKTTPGFVLVLPMRL